MTAVGREDAFTVAVGLIMDDESEVTLSPDPDPDPDPDPNCATATAQKADNRRMLKAAMFRV